MDRVNSARGFFGNSTYEIWKGRKQDLSIEGLQMVMQIWKILGQSNKKFWGKNCSLKEPWAGQKCPYLLNVLVKLHRLLWAVQEELGLSLKAEADLGGTKIWNLSAQWHWSFCPSERSSDSSLLLSQLLLNHIWKTLSLTIYLRCSSGFGPRSCLFCTLNTLYRKDSHMSIASKCWWLINAWL